MDPGLIPEALRLRAEGVSLTKTSAAIGVTRGVLSGALSRHKLGLSMPRKSPVFTEKHLDEAALRHKAGEPWQDIADHLGVGRTTLLQRYHAREGRRRENAKGAVHQKVGVAVWQKRPIRPVIKPREDVAKLARMFAAGKISREQLMRGISA